MTKSQIFTAAHKLAKTTTNNFGGHYQANFSLALKEVYASLATPQYDLSDDWADEWTEALDRIEDGARFNGKVYTRRQGKHRYAMQVYLDGECFSLGWEWKEDAKAAKAKFLSNLGGATPANSSRGKGYDITDTNSVAYVLSGMNGE